MSLFVISLDFELFWGVRDSRGEEYYQQLLNVHEVVPKLLKLFEKYEISCTWATVGALGAEDYDAFIDSMPEKLPSYENKKFSPFNDLGGLTSLDARILFAPTLVKKINGTERQELASHTFSHYYALEKGQVIEEFEADLVACSTTLSNNSSTIKSLVFPRNQFNPEYLSACKKNGYTTYRGNPSHWAYCAENRKSRSALKRLFRFVDSYIPLSGSLRQRVMLDAKSGMVDVPASIFFRPYNPKLKFLEGLKLRRLKWSMTQTAKKGQVFHLWWHPHNFGKYSTENLMQVEDLLLHFSCLNKKYNFMSVTMDEAKNCFFEENI